MKIDSSNYTLSVLSSFTSQQNSERKPLGTIRNSGQYSPQGGRDEVEVRTRDESTQLRVSDAGPGIPVELRERVFDRFFRDPGQMQSGSGLGLAIVKAVAQQHNSSVSLSTSAEGGLMVTVDFPNPQGRLKHNI